MEKLVFGLAFFVLITSSSAHANLLENVGTNSASAGLGGISAQGPGNQTAALSNPALLSGSNLRTDRLKLQFSVVSLAPSIDPIQSVVVANDYTAGTGAGSAKSENVDTDYKTTLGTTLSAGYRFGDQKKWGAGFFAYLPSLQIFYTDTGEAFVPEYLLHRARTQRPQFSAAFAHSFSSTFSVGFGAQLAYSLTGNGTVNLTTNTGVPSSMRFSASMKPLLQPYLGLAWEPSSKLQTGLVFRFARASDVRFTLNSSARFFGPLGALDFNFKAASAMAYDPASLELAQTFRLNDRLSFFAQVDAQLWKNFQAPALNIQDPASTCSAGGCTGLYVSGSQNPTFGFQNIVVPRAAIEWKLPGITLRSGYFYRPGIIAAGSVNGTGNLLDPSRHSVSAGAGWTGPKFLEFDAPYSLDFHVVYQKLISETVVKSSGNEVGNVADSKIGSPGYQVGGKLFGAGISLSLQI